MRLLFVFALLLIAGASCAFGQRSFGYGFIGSTFGGPSSGPGGGFRYGIGGETPIARQLTVGGEIGGIQQHGSGAVASGNLAYHFDTRSRGVDPFVTGGVSGVWLHERSAAYANLGGGVNYWVDRQWGVRAEFRGYPGGSSLGGFGEFRFGVVFR